MGEKDDEFGLNLSLSLASSYPDKQNPPPPPPPSPLNLMLSSSSFMNVNQKGPCKFNPPAFQSSSDRNVVVPPNVGGIDVNLPAITADGEEEMVVSSPNSTVSSVSHGKRSAEREENEAEEDGGDAAERKKLRLSKEQSAMLEETFKEYNTLNQKQKVDLAKELNLRPRQVEVWFQNRRARTKLKQTEVDCDYLRRCCEALTKENKRLQKEVSELRALKLSPQFYMNISPPTTLTMCPQCQRLAVSSSVSSASACSTLPTSSTANRGSHYNPVGPQPQHFPKAQHEDHRPRS